MRIACCLNGIVKIGGAERRLARIFDALNNENNQITFVLIKFDNNDEVLKTYKKYIKSEIDIVLLRRRYSTLYSYAKNAHFDVVCYIGPYRDMMPFLIGAKSGGSKCVWLLVNTFFANYMFDNLGQKILFNITGKLSDQIDCLYPSSIERISEITRKPVSLTPCPFTDFTLFYPLHKTKTIVFLGRLVKGKNCDLFLYAIERCKSKMLQYGYRAVVAGDGDEKESLELLSSTLGIDDIVEFKGYVQPEHVLPDASVYVSLQDNNNYPSQALIEAISCGCYIVATNVGDTDIIVKKEFGKLCAFDANEIAYALSEYIDFSDDKKQILNNDATQFARTTFSVDSSVKHYSKLFFELGEL